MENEKHASQPLLSDDSASETVVYTPLGSTSETETLLGDDLPPYHDVTPAYTPPTVENAKGDPKADDEEADSVPVRRRGCCGRRFGRTKKYDRKHRLRRRLFLFAKIFFVAAFISFLIGKKCVRAKKAKDTIFAHCPQVGYDPQSREIVHEENGSRSIWGRYPLYDLLSLKTTSGSIVVTVEPQPADPKHPDEPARLVLETVSGSVAVSFAHPRLDAILERDDDIDWDTQSLFPDEEEIQASCKQHHRRRPTAAAEAVPFRPYEIVIKTISGSVSSKLIFSSSAHVETGTGSISASLIPIVSSERPFSNATLVTRTHSGSQQIALKRPFRVPSSSPSPAGNEGSWSGAPNYATASHVSHSGHIDVVYPHSWAGTIDAVAHSGAICLDGPGLEVTKDGQGHASAVKYAEDSDEDPEWWGGRGDMNVSLEAKGSGSITFFVKRAPHAG